MAQVDLTQQQFQPTNYQLHYQNYMSHHGLHGLSEQKWMYLISDSISFSGKFERAIRLKKPTEDVLFSWMEKIVLGGQCSALFVQNLQLDDFRTIRIKALCEQYAVTLVNLTSHTKLPDNLIVGPWH